MISLNYPQMSDIESDESISDVDIKKKLAEEFLSLDKPSLPAQPPIGQERMRVFLRVRPFTETELNIGENQVCLNGLLK
jgi:hypothetical protein